MRRSEIFSDMKAHGRDLQIYIMEEQGYGQRSDYQVQILSMQEFSGQAVCG